MRGARGVWIGALALLAGALAGCPDTGGLMAGPRVLRTDPQQVVLSWETAADETSWLEVRRPESEAAERFDPESTAGRHRCRVADLAPATTYAYAVLVDGETRFEGRFRTAPRRGAPARFAFAVLGDSGKASRDQARLGARLASLEPELVLHTGDVLYSNDAKAVFLEPYAALLAQSPLWPTLGNHDLEYEPVFRELFDLPTDGPPGLPPSRNYVIDHGDARFAILDSNQGPRTLRWRIGRWLERKMNEPPLPRWRFVVLHHPPYTWGNHEPTLPVQTLVPLFESLGVQMVFSGHDHNYQRTAPMVGGRVAGPGEPGVVYVVSGAGGGDLDAIPPKAEWPDELRGGDGERFSATFVEVAPEGLTVRQVDADGIVIDRFDVPPNAAQTSAPRGREAAGGAP